MVILRFLHTLASIEDAIEMLKISFYCFIVVELTFYDEKSKKNEKKKLRKKTSSCMITRIVCILPVIFRNSCKIYDVQH